MLGAIAEAQTPTSVAAAMDEPTDARATASQATASASAPAGAAGSTTFLVENTTRAEVWRYFTPPPNAATRPDYTFIGSRSTLGVAYVGPRWTARGALQYVRLENLPPGSIGPGLLGTGAAYFFQAGSTFSYQFYLRALSLRWRDPARGLWIEAGRWSRSEAVREEPARAATPLAEGADLDSRLLGDMEWSLYQRAWDGVRAGVSRGGLSATVSAAMPTQGIFEESANLTMDRVRVVAAELTFAPGVAVAHTRLQGFAIRYDDTRAVSARPDNEPRELLGTGVDVHVTTVGASAIGRYPWRAGTLDLTVWGAAQMGSWFDRTHRAGAVTAAIGHRVERWPGRPRVGIGLSYASGDPDPRDDRHGTFFPLLPSGDRVSALNAYALMNVVDRWAALDLQVRPTVMSRTTVRRVGVANAADRWYQGSGATSRVGNYFGYQGRDGRGATSIGTAIDQMVEWRPRRWWTLRAYGGRLAGGDIVRRVFRGDRLVTAWLESTLHF